MKHFIKFRNGVIRVDSIDAMTKRRLLDDCYVSIWIVNTKLNNFFKGVFTILNWGQIT